MQTIITLSAYLTELGHKCVEHGIGNNKADQNLADERVLQGLIVSLGACAGLLIRPPCRTPPMRQPRP